MTSITDAGRSSNLDRAVDEATWACDDKEGSKWSESMLSRMQMKGYKMQDEK